MMDLVLIDQQIKLDLKSLVKKRISSMSSNFCRQALQLSISSYQYRNLTHLRQLLLATEGINFLHVKTITDYQSTFHPN